MTTMSRHGWQRHGDTTRSWDDFLESGEELTTLDVNLATALFTFFKDDQAHVTETSQSFFVVCR